MIVFRCDHCLKETEEGEAIVQIGATPYLASLLSLVGSEKIGDLCLDCLVEVFAQVTLNRAKGGKKK